MQNSVDAHNSQANETLASNNSIGTYTLLVHWWLRNKDSPDLSLSSTLILSLNCIPEHSGLLHTGAQPGER